MDCRSLFPADMLDQIRHFHTRRVNVIDLYDHISCFQSRLLRRCILINLCDRHLHAFLILGKTGTDPVEIALGLLHQILVFFFRIISGIRIV